MKRPSLPILFVRREIGEMAHSYEELHQYVIEATEIVRRIGDGDLTVAIKPRSSDDALGIALAEMAINLRGMIGQVSSTASDIAGASGQMADASRQAGTVTIGMSAATQLLADGAKQIGKFVLSIFTRMLISCLPYMSKLSIFPSCGKFTSNLILYFFPTSWPISVIFVYAIAGFFFKRNLICGKFDLSVACKSLVISVKLIDFNSILPEK